MQNYWQCSKVTYHPKVAQVARSVVNQSAEERGAVILHATFCGSRERVTAFGDPVAVGNLRPYRDLRILIPTLSLDQLV